MTIQITSSAFSEGGLIPRSYTCDEKDVSPDLAWTGIPAGTKTLALICDDPDAPVGTWVHWVLFNIPAGETGLPAEIAPEDEWCARYIAHLLGIGEYNHNEALRDSFAIRRAALNRGLPYFTTLAALRAAAGAIRAVRLESIGVRSLQEIHPVS